MNAGCTCTLSGCVDLWACGNKLTFTEERVSVWLQLGSFLFASPNPRKLARLAWQSSSSAQTLLPSRQRTRALPVHGEAVAAVTEGREQIQSVAQILCHVVQQRKHEIRFDSWIKSKPSSGDCEEIWWRSLSKVTTHRKPDTHTHTHKRKSCVKQVFTLLINPDADRKICHVLQRSKVLNLESLVVFQHGDSSISLRPGEIYKRDETKSEQALDLQLRGSSPHFAHGLLILAECTTPQKSHFFTLFCIEHKPGKFGRM